ncbi:MAG: cytochrome c [Desulfobulbaceae bacterium]
MSRIQLTAAAFFLAVCHFFLSPQTTLAVINGYCAGCHTMHNSQDNLPMRFDGGTTPIGQLLRGDCFGCHAQGGAVTLFSVGVDVIPQVFHNATQPDLAGGNFGYITGLAGSGPSDTKGHNIAALTGTDATLTAPPGGIVQVTHNDGGNVNTNVLTCAGTNGCHGNRYYSMIDPNYEGITGAHHDNVNGQVDPAAGDMEPGHGYRFLVGTKGYEDTDWQFTKSASDHNEYFGQGTPASLGCTAALNCHGAGGVRPPNGTISEFCATCHGNFHTLATSTSSGIGPAAASPFIRHPSDYSLPASGEYTSYITYDTSSPVARIGAVPASASSTVTPGSDAVMCLSCHVAHGSDYDDMLKWDYSTMVVSGGATSPAGCFACHSAKD